MDYSITLIFTLILLAQIYTIYYAYFKRCNKISDKQLMQNYIALRMKQDNSRYFPKMRIDYE